MNIENIINQSIKDTKLIKINKDMFLTNFEITILKAHKIQYEVCKNYQELLFFIESVLEQNDDSQDLEQIILSISERNYYQNTHK